MMNAAWLRLLAASSASGSGTGDEDLPQTNSLYAAERYDDPPATEKHENLYQTCDRMVGASDVGYGETHGRGGIEDTFGDPSHDLDFLIDGGPTTPKPNAVNPCAGSALEACLRVLAQRLPGENDPLTLDQENYGSGSHLKEATAVEAFWGGPGSGIPFKSYKSGGGGSGFKYGGGGGGSGFKYGGGGGGFKSGGGGGGSGFNKKAPPKPSGKWTRKNGAEQRLSLVAQKSRLDAMTFMKYIQLWFSGTIGTSKASSAGNWGKLPKKDVQNFITGLAQIGRLYPTPVPKFAYRICRKASSKPTPIGYEGKLNIGPRPMLSFAKSANSARKFGSGIRPFARVAVRVPVNPQNYVATYESIAEFAREAKVYFYDKADDEGLSKEQIRTYGNAFNAARKLSQVVEGFESEDEIILVFKPNQSVEVKVCGVAAKGDKFDHVVATLLRTAPAMKGAADHDFDLGEEVDAGTDELQLFDPDQVSQYSREATMPNTTENPIRAHSVEARDVLDGDFDSHGKQGADRLVTDDPDTNGYLHVHSRYLHNLVEARRAKHPKPPKDKTRESQHKKTKHTYPDDLEDETWEYIARDPEDDAAGQEVTGDASPKLFNVANQPMGFSG